MEIKKLIYLITVVFIFISFSGCDWKIVNKSEEEKKSTQRVDIVRDELTLRTVVLFETQSQTILSGRKKVCQEEQESAKQFLTDLKIVNDALPEDSKILNSNGRLVDLATASSNQKQSMADIVFNSVGTAKHTPEVEAAVLRLSQRMSETRRTFDITTKLIQE